MYISAHCGNEFCWLLGKTERGLSSPKRDGFGESDAIGFSGVASDYSEFGGSGEF